MGVMRPPRVCMQEGGGEQVLHARGGGGWYDVAFNGGERVVMVVVSGW